jgi:hypothetical protein
MGVLAQLYFAIQGILSIIGLTMAIVYVLINLYILYLLKKK